MIVRSTLKWVIILAALLAIGPVAGLLIGGLRGPGGADATTPFLSNSFMGGIAVAAAVFALAAATGLFASRFFGSRTGMTCAGLVLAWAAWSTGSLDALLAQARAAAEVRSMLLRLTFEGACLGIASLALAYGILRCGARIDALILQQRDPQRAGPAPVEPGAVAVSVLAGIALGALVTWWVAFQPLKGQVIFGALAGAIAAAAVAHLMAPHFPARISALAAFAALAVLAAFGPLSGLFIGQGATARAAAAGLTSHLAFPTGLDWAAGAFLGVPIGLGWSGSMVEKHATKETPAEACA